MYLTIRPRATDAASGESRLMTDSKMQRPRRLAVLCGELTPYRVHFHRRLARELHGFSLSTLLYTNRNSTPWKGLDAPEIGVLNFVPARPAGSQEIQVIRSNNLRALVRHPQLVPRWRTFLAEWAESSRLLDWLRENRPEAVIVNGYYGLAYLRTIAWCWRNNVPAFLFADSNVHADYAVGFKYILKRLFVSPVLACCAGMLPCASAGMRFFERYSSRRDRMFYCPYEPDYAEIEQVAADGGFVESIRERFKLPRERKRIISVCRLVHVKRVDTVIDAFVKIAADRPEWDLLIVGDGPKRDELMTRVPDWLRARIIFAGFVGDQRVVNALYRLSDVMTLASEYEPWALVINEAAASGLAIVTTNVVGAALELVRDRENGRVFTPGEVAEFAEAMRDATDSERLADMKAASLRILARWREKADPINGVIHAMASAGIKLV